MIPAAGRATRLLPPDSELPKNLLDLAGRPLLLWLLEQLPDSVSDICLVVNDLEGPIPERVGEQHNGRRIHYVLQPEPVGVGDAILRAEPFVRGSFLVVMGDVYFDRSLCFFADDWRRSGADGAVLVAPVSGEPRDPIGLVTIRDNAIDDIWKAEHVGHAQGRVCGAAILPDDAFEARHFLGSGSPSELELEDVISWLIADRNKTFLPVTYTGWRRNVNTPDDLSLVLRHLEERR